MTYALWTVQGLLALLFLCLPAWACFALSTPVLWNTGRKHHEFLLLHAAERDHELPAVSELLDERLRHFR